MESFTRRLWSEQDKHQGDRLRLFSAIRAAFPGNRVLYPGSFVDIAPSAVYPRVTYVDVDKRTPRFFGDRDGIAEITRLSLSTPTIETTSTSEMSPSTCWSLCTPVSSPNIAPGTSEWEPRCWWGRVTAMLQWHP